MGLRNRQRVGPVSREVLDFHNRHGKVTFEDWELKGPRVKRAQEVEAREAEWMMRNRGRWALMDREAREA